MDMSSLSARQRANVAGLQLKRDAIRRRYGNSVQILTTDEEAAMSNGWMALPLNLVNTGKQLTFRMDKDVIDTKNARKLSSISREDMADTNYVEDVVTALENSARALTGGATISKPTNKPAEAQSRKPTAKAVSSVSDSDFIKSLLG